MSSRVRPVRVAPVARCWLRVVTCALASVRVSVLVGVLIGVLAQSGLAWAGASGSTPLDLIQGMSEAQRTRNYRGTYVQVSDKATEVFEIIHGYDESRGESERLMSLTGEARQIFRDEKTVTCIWPGSESVIVSSAKPRKLVPLIDQSLQSNEQYQLKQHEDDRVADRPAYVVDITPVDAFRYGYRFWIDQETGVLLRSLLYDEYQRRVEEIIFTSISFPDGIAVEELDTASAHPQGFVLDRVDAPEKVSVMSTVPANRRVSFSSLPSGYRQLSESHEKQPMKGTAVTHVMLSDGMASVSVYAEFALDDESNDAMEEMEGDARVAPMSRMGSVGAVVGVRDSAIITVVGEVPMSALKMIESGVRIGQAE